MWIMKKKIRGKNYLYLYKSEWVNKKPISKFVRYIGQEDKYAEGQLDKVIENIIVSHLNKCS